MLYNSLHIQSTAYNASTNTPNITQANGYSAAIYQVTTGGLLTGVTVTGATVGANSVLFAGDQILVVNGTYSLFTPNITQSVTINVGTGQNFTTLQSVVTYLASRVINPNVTVTIQLTSTYSATADSGTITFNHPQSSQIVLQGTASATTNVTACTGVTGTNGNAVATYTLAAAIAGLAVGDYVFIDTETSTNNNNTTMLSAHCGVWRVTAVSGATVSVNNIQVGRVVLTNALFGTAKMTKCSVVGAQLIFDGANGITIGSVIVAHNNNTPYIQFVNSNGMVASGYIGMATTSATSNCTAFTFVMLNSDISDSSDGFTQGVGQLSIAGAKSSRTDQYLVVNSSIQIGLFILGLGLGAVNNGSVFAFYKYGSIQSANASIVIINDAVCNSKAGGNSTSSGSIYIVTQTACNSNDYNGNSTESGNITIVIQTACNSNASAGNSTYSGSIYINTQTACNSNGYGNATSSGCIYIFTQNACTGNTIQNNYTPVGKVLIQTGTSTTTGVVGIAGGRGSVVKVNGTSPFTVSG